MGTNGLWRPPQWSAPVKVSITAQGVSTTTQLSTPSSENSLATYPGLTNSYSLTTTTPTVPLPTYVFDAVFSLDHDQRLTKTQHPVQTGADISTHAYLQPAQLVMYVGMSDAMAAYNAAWTGNPSKSVSAYTTLLALQTARIPLTVTTRLRTYQNMLIDYLSPREDNKTVAGLRMRIEFGQIFIGLTSSNPISARSNDTASTGLGPVNTQPVPATVTKQFAVAAGSPNTEGSPAYSSYSGPQVVTGTNNQGGA